MNGTPTAGGGFALTVGDLNWKIVNTADFNGDGRADILYRRETTGELYLHLMNGTTSTAAGFINTEAD